MRPFSIPLVVVVVGGVGSATYTGFGHMKIVTIKPVPTAPTYDFEIDNLNAHQIEGLTGLIGNQTVEVDVPVVKGGTFYIQNATKDGTYNVELSCLSTPAGL